METPHYRKLDLQSPLDLTYLHNNTVSLSRQKLDLHFPPSASTSSSTAGPDPMRERVRELVDEVCYTPSSLYLSLPVIHPIPSLQNIHNTFHKSYIQPTTLTTRTYEWKTTVHNKNFPNRDILHHNQRARRAIP